jgi:hypothetical protein
MPGVAAAGLVILGLSVIGCLFLALVLIADDDTPPQRLTAAASMAASAAASGSLAPVQLGPWTLAQAGLTPAAAWLTAPRESEDYARIRAAIATKYDRAEKRNTTALRRAGLTKRKGWTCE